MCARQEDPDKLSGNPIRGAKGVYISMCVRVREEHIAGIDISYA